jgi:hypothetical protein
MKSLSFPAAEIVLPPSWTKQKKLLKIEVEAMVEIFYSTLKVKQSRVI